MVTWSRRLIQVVIGFVIRATMDYIGFSDMLTRRAELGLNVSIFTMTRRQTAYFLLRLGIWQTTSKDALWKPRRIIALHMARGPTSGSAIPSGGRLRISTNLRRTQAGFITRLRTTLLMELSIRSGVFRGSQVV